MQETKVPRFELYSNKIVMMRTLYAQTKWPEDYSERCSNCNVIIKLGRGGPANMVQHVGRKQCLKDAKRRKEQTAKKRQSDFFALFCKPKDAVQSVVLPPTVIRDACPSPDRAAAELTLESLPNIPPLFKQAELTASQNTSLASEVSASEPEEHITPLARLTELVPLLPNSVPLATVNDRSAVFGGEPTDILFGLQLEHPPDEPSEWLNQKLDSICGVWAIQNGHLASSIKHGEYGLEGVCRVLNHFVKNGLIEEVLIRERVEILLKETQAR